MGQTLSIKPTWVLSGLKFQIRHCSCTHLRTASTLIFKFICQLGPITTVYVERSTEADTLLDSALKVIADN